MSDNSKEDLLLFLKMIDSSKPDLNNKDAIQKVLKSCEESSNFKSLAGKIIKNRLKQKIENPNAESVCILCKTTEAKNNLICDNCLEEASNKIKEQKARNNLRKNISNNQIEKEESKKDENSLKNKIIIGVATAITVVLGLIVAFFIGNMYGKKSISPTIDKKPSQNIETVEVVKEDKNQNENSTDELDNKEVVDNTIIETSNPLETNIDVSIDEDDISDGELEDENSSVEINKNSKKEQDALNLLNELIDQDGCRGLYVCGKENYLGRSYFLIAAKYADGISFYVPEDDGYVLAEYGDTGEKVLLETVYDEVYCGNSNQDDNKKWIFPDLAFSKENGFQYNNLYIGMSYYDAMSDVLMHSGSEESFDSYTSVMYNTRKEFMKNDDHTPVIAHEIASIMGDYYLFIRNMDATEGLSMCKVKLLLKFDESIEGESKVGKYNYPLREIQLNFKDNYLFSDIYSIICDELYKNEIECVQSRYLNRYIWDTNEGYRIVANVITDKKSNTEIVEYISLTEK